MCYRINEFKENEMDMPPELYQEAFDRIIATPQGDTIPADRIEHWIYETYKLEPDALLWHVDRLNAIGGSEIGAFARYMSATRAQFANEVKYSHKSPRQILDGKYLKAVPEEQAGPLLRGNIFESTLQQLHIANLKRVYKNVVIREDLKEAIVKAGDLPNGPILGKQIRNQIDDIFECDGKIIATDYKFPSEAGLVALNASDMMEYNCQLLSIRMIAEQMPNPIKIDKLELAVMDIAKCAFQYTEMSDTKELRDDITHAAEYFTDLIANGEYQEPLLPRFEIKNEDDIPPSMKDNLRQFAIYKVIASQAEQHAKALNSKIVNELDGMMGSGEVTNLEITSGIVKAKIMSTRKLDKQAAVDLLTPVLGVVAVTKIQGNQGKLLSELKKVYPDNTDYEHCWVEETVSKVITDSSKKGDRFELKTAMQEAIGVSSLPVLVQDLKNECEPVIESINLGTKDRMYYQLDSLRKIVSGSLHGSEIVEVAENLLTEREVKYAPYIKSKPISKTHYSQAHLEEVAAMEQDKSLPAESNLKEEAAGLVGSVLDGVVLDENNELSFADPEKERELDEQFQNELHNSIVGSYEAYSETLAEMTKPIDPLDMNI